MTAISDLPMLNDIDADYSPQYKLAHIVRGKIEVGEHKRGDAIPAVGLARERKVIDSGRMGRAREARRQQLATVIEALPKGTARMLAVEILLAEPESLGDDVLESCLYVLREKLMAAS
jgi:hypothetical protein